MSATFWDMPKSQHRDNEYISPSEAATIAHLSTKQLTRLADSGKIAFIRPGTHRKYLRSDIERLGRPSSEWAA